MSIGLQNFKRFIDGESIDSILNGCEKKLSSCPSRSSSNNLINTSSRNHITVRNIDGILAYNEDQMEDDHSYIQWVFPTPRASAFNGNAPIISKEEIKELRNDPKVIEVLNKFKNKMFNYWGLDPKDTIRIRILNGHDGLRLSRAIECLTLFGIDVFNIFLILQECIGNGILKPHCEVYKSGQGGQAMPIWYIRYFENLEQMEIK